MPDINMLEKLRLACRNELFRNLRFTVSGKVVAVLINFALGIFVARVLTKEDFGKISALSAFSSYFIMLADYSTFSVAQRNIILDRERYRDTYYVYANTKLITSVLSALLFYAVAIAAGYGVDTELLLILSASILVGALCSFPEILLQSFGEYGIFSRLMVVEALAALVIQGGMVYRYRTVGAFFASSLVVSVVILALNFFMVGRKFDVVRKHRVAQGARIMALLRDSTPVLLGSFFYILYYRIGVIMLEKFAGYEAAAEYNMAFSRFDQIINIIWVQFIIVFYPKMIETWDRGPVELERILGKVSLGLIGVFSLLFFVSHYMAEFFFGLVYSQKYADSGRIFTLLVPSFLMTTLFGLYYRVLIIAKKEMVYTVLMAVGAVVNYVVGYTLVKSFGAIGMVASISIVNAIILTSTYVMVRKCLRAAY